MKGQSQIDTIPAALDCFLGDFFDRRAWRSEIKYDPERDCLYLDVRLAGDTLAGDDRFLSLVERFGRVQSAFLSQRAGMPLQCRLFAADGDELTTLLHRRGSSYLDDDARGTRMRRRLAWLSFRRRLVARALPGALLWSGALVFVVVVVGLPPATAFAIAAVAVVVQIAGLLLSASARG